jgi:hypothetical protein
MCRDCGRTHVEIARTWAMVAEIVGFVSKTNYENPEEFMVYLTGKILKNSRQRRMRLYFVIHDRKQCVIRWWPDLVFVLEQLFGALAVSDAFVYR